MEQWSKYMFTAPSLNEQMEWIRIQAILTILRYIFYFQLLVVQHLYNKCVPIQSYITPRKSQHKTNKIHKIHYSKAQKLDDQTNIDKYRVATTIKINIPSFQNSCIHVFKNVKIKCLKWTHGLFWHNYRVSTLSRFNLTVSGISIRSLKFIGKSLHG